MIKLKKLIFEMDILSSIKWIIGYIDAYGKLHHRVIRNDDLIDSHNKIWPMVHHNKWRWTPSNSDHINTYGETLDDDSICRIWTIIDKYKND